MAINPNMSELFESSFFWGDQFESISSKQFEGFQ